MAIAMLEAKFTTYKYNLSIMSYSVGGLVLQNSYVYNTSNEVDSLILDRILWRSEAFKDLGREPNVSSKA